jgi:rod shape-determining protein MreC
MDSLFGRYKSALVLMLVLLAQVVLLAMQVRRPVPGMPEGHNVLLWRYLVTSVVTPPERWAHNMGQGVRGVWTHYVDLRHLREQNDNLQQENDRLRLEQASLAQDAAEGERLRELLDFRGRYIDKTVAAQVVGTSGTDQARDIYVDKGEQDGIAAQMPVITPDGIVGKVKAVFPHSAQIMLISDQTSGTGVLLEETRVRGVMKGNTAGQPQVVNISPDDRIKPGEPVITSGGDQVYPPGMPVGVVDHVVSDPDSGSYVNVVIKPNANLGALEEVLVVVQFSDKMPFNQIKDLAQSESVALAEKQRAADIMAERLPSLHDHNAEETESAAAAQNPGSTASTSDGDPARPMRPPQPLHPDRYSPGAAPSASELVPGAGPPVTHRTPGTQATTPSTAAGTKPNTASTATTYAADTPMSRFPAKPSPAIVKPTTQADAAGTSSGSATGTSAATKTNPSGASTASSAAAPVHLSSTTATGSTAASSGQPRSTSTSAATASSTGTTPRKAATPADSDSSDSGGILTPAGMGNPPPAPRPKPQAPKPPAQSAPSTGSGAPAQPQSQPASTPPSNAPGGGT